MRGVGAACAALALSLSAAPPLASAARAAPDTLQRQFGAAAARSHVPRSVLLGVAYLESRWDGHGGAPSVSGGYGPMHLTDARTASAGTGARLDAASGDPRGDRSRPRTEADPPGRRPEGKPPARLRTLVKAARLTGLSAAALRTDPDANLRGGAALLADAQRRLGRPLGDDPSDWYGAVAAYSGADDAGTAKDFADEVFSVIRGGQTRVTDTGQRVVLAPDPGVRTERGQADRLGLRGGGAGGPAECPPDLACEWLPAAYAKFKGDDGKADYGNHDLARRPADQKIRYVVVHDIEGSYDSALTDVRDPEKVSWNYTVRSADGHVAQHVRHRDVAWHAGNWQVNSQSVGIEHEGFLSAPDSWFTEAMYRSSARLVRWITRRYGIPLDRLHILGHDNVPAPTPAAIRDMHTDPGPYWDWQHYFTLLGRPFEPAGRAGGDVVTIRPAYTDGRPAYTSCSRAGDTCPPHGSAAVRLYQAPDANAPLATDAGLHPGGAPSTTGVGDVGARASTGQRFAVAGRSGDWTAIWILGRKAWFRNAGAVPGRAPTLTPKPGVSRVQVYGRALPEKEAYPKGVLPEKATPLPYTIRPGQRYVSGGTVRGEHYRAVDFRGRRNRVVRGRTLYYEIQFGHRIAFVRADQVRAEG